MGVQKAPTKVSLKLTARVKRLVVLLFVASFAVTWVFVWLGSMVSILGFTVVGLTPLLLPVLLLLCNFLLWPTEEWIRAGYLSRAKKKLARPEFSNLIKIGITGSWGKTSCKNILAAMLSEKYSVAASPSSFNTPMGFTKTVNNILSPGNEVLIFEMGARYVGDIKYLCRLFNPTHGIMTGIGPQHIETFGSIENIKRAKGDLLHSLPPGGIAVTNGDNEKCCEVFAELKSENKYKSTFDKSGGGEGYVSDISVTHEGCNFMLHLGGRGKTQAVRCTTRLLGKHNIQNILMCAIMANKLGITPAQIAAAVARLSPTPHRLELIRAENGILVLDDSYNASPAGTVAALEVLSLFKGAKVVLTPGLVELGTRGAEENFKFGARLASVADKVIVVNELNKSAIVDGLNSQSYSAENIFTAASLDDAKQIYSKLLKKGDVLLIENDLPDNYL
jgi:UDP-N-acetylmuramoyl-tripeptide--D-alanyl-D-alanine ligase